MKKKDAKKKKKRALAMKASDRGVDPVPQPVLKLLKKIMAEKGLTTSSLARRAGVNPQNCYDNLAGKKIPQIDTLAKLAAQVGYKVTLVPLRS